MSKLTKKILNGAFTTILLVVFAIYYLNTLIPRRKNNRDTWNDIHIDYDED